MAYTTVLDKIPLTLTSGDSISWAVSLSDYPASESWELTYTLVKSGTNIQIVASASGNDHLIEVPSETTSEYDSGEYEYQAHVSNGTERYQVDSGIVEIVIDFSQQASGYDPRSDVKKSLDALWAAYYGRASKTQLHQTIGGIQVQHMQPNQIREEINAMEIKYRHELVVAGKIKSRRTIKTRFA